MAQRSSQFDSERGKAAAQRSHEEREKRAREAREHFLGVIAGAKVRVTHLPRELIAECGFAVANKMLMDILTEQFPVTSAKDAAQIAKVALDMARLEYGDPSSNLGELTVEERDKRMAAIKEFRAGLVKKYEENEAEEATRRAAETNAVSDDSSPSATLAAVRPIFTGDPQEE